MSNKDYVLTTHAKDRMLARGISESELEIVLEDAEISHPGPCGERHAIKTINRRRIKVCYVMTGKKKRIITVMVVN